MSENDGQYIRIDVTGEDPNLWKKIRSKLIKAIENLMDSEIDPINHSTIKEEAAKFTSALLDYGMSKLLKPGIENAVMLTEIEETYTKISKAKAEQRKINAEAESIELSNKIKKLKIITGLCKVFVSGNSGTENVLFIKEINNFLEVLNQLEDDNSYLKE